MKCVDPVWIRNPNYDPDVDPRQKIQVRCGKCWWCASARRAEWFSRLSNEVENCPLSLFVTLTQEDVKQTDVVDKHRLQNFFRYLRRDNDDFTFRYYAIGEYGSKRGRPHFHALLFVDSLVSDPYVVDEKIRKCWSHGFIKIGEITPARVNYCLHFHVRPKNNDYFGSDRPTFAICSQGLGMHMTPEFEAWLMDSSTVTFKTLSGDYAIVPRYYRKKLCIDISEREYEEKQLFDFYETAMKYGWEQAWRLRHSYRKHSEKMFKKYNSQEYF